MGTRKNKVFRYLKTLGRVLGGIKSPCGNRDRHSLGFPHKNTVFGYGKTLGRVLGGIKKRRRQLAPATPRFYLFGRSFSVEITAKIRISYPCPKGRKVRFPNGKCDNSTLTNSFDDDI